jgi:hypothetical protein
MRGGPQSGLPAEQLLRGTYRAVGLKLPVNSMKTNTVAQPRELVQPPKNPNPGI